MVTTSLSLIAVPGHPQTFGAKTPADFPAVGLLVDEFDLFVQDYAGKTVVILKAGTTELMPCYSDPELTVSIENPQVLLTKTDGLGNTYGKFAQHVYVPFAYQLDISSSEDTGVRRVPITKMDGEICDNGIVKASGSTEYRSLAARAADIIRVEDFGQITDSSTTNTNTITAAISAASSMGGGTVRLPAGTIVITALTVPTSVILQGEGREVTIIQSQLAGKVITFTGNAAGLKDLKLDGVNLLEGSIGLYGKSQDFIILESVEVKRFDRNVVWQGGQNHVYRNLFIRNGNTGMECLGDSDLSGGGLGDEYSGMDWFQGEISTCTEAGLLLEIIDLPVRHNTISQVDFLDNTATEGALKIVGASWQYFHQCYWDGNVTNIQVKDNADLNVEDRQVSNIYFTGGQIQDGESIFDGFCQDILFDGMELNDCDFDLTTPDNPILLRDCTEDLTLFTGTTTKIIRVQTVNDGSVKGVTTDATATTVYKVKLRPNEVIQLAVYATAERTNGAGYADFVYICGARCAGATLAYDTQTSNFTAGSTVVGQTSGASAIIVSDSDSGTTGVLTLSAVSGVFVDNEIIAEEAGSGSATVNGSLVLGAAALISTATEVRAAGSNAGAPPSGWAVTFTALVQEILVKVTGASSNDIFWNVRVEATIL